MRRSLFAFIGSTLIGLLWASVPLCAQNQSVSDGVTPTGLAPGSPAGSYPLSGFEHYNPFSGNLSVALPLYHVGGRGEAGFDLVWNFAQTWHASKRYFNNGPVIPIDPYPGSYPAGSPQVMGLQAAGAVYARTGTSYVNCGGNIQAPASSVTRIVFRTPDGTEIELVDQATNGAAYSVANPCSFSGGTADANRGTTFRSTDTGALKFVSDSNVLESFSYTYGEGDAKVSGYLYFSNGLTYRIVNSDVSWIRDRNGNLTSIEYQSGRLIPVTWNLSVDAASQITDPVGRLIKLNYSDSSCGGCTSITYPGLDGASRAIKIGFGTLSGGLLRPGSGYAVQHLGQLFPQGNPAPGYDFDPTLPSYVQFPNGYQFQFLYNSFGELARITLPTAGAIEYDYGDGHNGSLNGFEGLTSDANPIMIYRRLQERREYSGGGSTMTSRVHHSVSYVGTTTVETDTTYDASGTAVARTIHTISGSPLDALSLTATSCNAWNEGLEAQTEFGAPNTLVTVANTYTTQSGCMNNPQLTTQTTTQNDSNAVSKVTFSYDSYNNVTDKVEYDWGAASPGGKLRDTTTAYLTTQTYLDANLVRLPAEVKVFDGGTTLFSDTQYVYDGTGMTDAPQIVQHDNVGGVRGNVSSIKLCLNAASCTWLTTTMGYDIAGNPISVTDANSHQTALTFEDAYSDAIDRKTYAHPKTSTNAAGQQRSWTYDFSTGQPRTATDLSGAISTYSFADTLDRLTKIVYPNGGSTVFGYPDATTVTTKQDQTTANDGLLNATTTYDGLGRLVESDMYEDSSHYIATKQTYNAQGLVETMTNPRRPVDTLNVTTYSYDSLGRNTQVKTPDTAAAKVSYAGNQTTSEDQAHKKRTMTMDALGRMTTVVEDPGTLNLATGYTYDPLGNLKLVTQGTTCPDTPAAPPQAPTAGCRYYTYDSLSRLTKSVQPESGSAAYTYDPVGNLQQRTDARGIVTTYSYDALNRISQQTYTGGTPTVNYTYDAPGGPTARGMLTIVANGSSVTNYLNYDVMGKVLSSNQGIGGQTYPFSYAYNLAGALTSETYPSGRVLTMTYDNANRASQLSGAVGGNTTTYVSNFIYAAQGAATQYKYGNDLWRQATYNNRLQPDTVADQVSNNPSNQLLKLTWDWGGASNNGSVMGLNANHGVLSFNQTFGYDALNRLHTASDTGGWSRTFNYDRYGNLWTDPAYTGPTPGGATANLYNSANQVNGGSYDAAGNQILLGGSAVAYDAENRQKSVTDPPNVMPGTETYLYDGLGQRVEKSGPTGTIIYVYDALGQLAAEYSTASVTAPCATCYLSADHLGSTRLVTDVLAHVIGRHDFFPFGEEIGANSAGRGSAWGPGNDNIYQRFTGQERDQETGLDFFQARYYASGPGRFLSPDSGNEGADPSNPQSWNAYGYVDNDPLNSIDPSGSCAVVVAGAGQPFEAAGPFDKLAASLGAYQSYPYAGQWKGIAYLYAIGATFGSNSATATALTAMKAALSANTGKIDIVTFSGGAAAFTGAYGSLSSSDQARIGNILHLSPSLAGAVAVNGSSSVVYGNDWRDVVATIGTEVPLGTPMAGADCGHRNTDCLAQAAAKQIDVIRANGPCKSPSIVSPSGTQPSQRGSASSTIIYGQSANPGAFGWTVQATYGSEGNYTGSVWLWNPGPASPPKAYIR